MNLIFGTVFYVLQIFFLRGLLISYKRLKNLKEPIDHFSIFGINIYIFTPIICFFLLGNITLVLNFFFSQQIIQPYFLFLFIAVILMNFYEKFNFDTDKKNLSILYVFIPLILFFSSYGMRLHFDATDYHLISQNWIRSSKIVFGLSNVYAGYGWSTIYEYIQANFWFNKNFIYLHYINVSFFISFYQFLYINIFSSKNGFLKVASINLLLFGFLDNFGFGGGGNTFLLFQTIGKPDLTSGIIFTITGLLLFKCLLFDKKINNIEFFFISLFALFAFQLKILNSILIFLLVPFIFIYIKRNNQSFFSILKNNLLTLMFFIFYLIKNIIVTGCVIFPISLTCISKLSWTDKDFVKNYAEGVRLGNFGIPNLSALNFNEWYSSWINNAYNFNVYRNFLLSLLIIVFINQFITSSYELKIQNIYFLRLFQVFSIFFFLYSGPTVRYGLGITNLLISTLNLKKSIKSTIKNKNTNYLILLIFCITLIGTPRFYSYKYFLSSPLTEFVVESKTGTYEKNPNGWGVVTLDPDFQCYTRINCLNSPSEIKPIKLNDYILFKPTKR